MRSGRRRAKVGDCVQRVPRSFGEGSPSIVYVFPVPVWPYAMIDALYPDKLEQTGEPGQRAAIKRRGARAHRDHSPREHRVACGVVVDIRLV